MSVWERYHNRVSVTAAGDHVNEQVFFNQQADENFEASDVIAVDGILTILTDTDDLVGIRLLVAPQQMLTSDLTEDSPAPHNRMVWYSFFAGRGPMVFRLRSKKTVHPSHKLWIQVWKATGASVTLVSWGFHVLWVVKH